MKPPERSPVLYKRRRQTFGVVNEIVAKTAFHAEAAVVGFGNVVPGGNLHHLVVLDVKLELAANPTIRAGGERLLELPRAAFEACLLVGEGAGGADRHALAAKDAIGLLLFGLRIDKKQPFKFIAFDQIDIDDFRNIFGRHIAIESPLGHDHHRRSHLAEAVAAGEFELDFVSKTGVVDGNSQGIINNVGFLGFATGAPANEELPFYSWSYSNCFWLHSESP